MKPNLRGSGVHIVYKKPDELAKEDELTPWAVIHVRDGKSSQHLPRHRTKTDAVQSGRADAKRWKLELYIHGRDGKIQRRDSYGKESKKKDKR